MADYIKREDAIDTACSIVFSLGGDIDDTVEMETSMEEIPAADVRPVVFCKDCRHRDPEDHKCDSGETERQGCPFPVHDDYFCAYGER